MSAKCHSFLLLFYCSTLFFFVQDLSAQEPVIISDTGRTVRIATTAFTKNSLPRYLKRFPVQKQQEALFYFLDSLGFFHPQLDTIAGDTIQVSPGIRTSIHSYVFESAYPLTIDSIARVRLPTPYNAAIVQSLAKQTITFLAQRGYPFASLSIHITDTALQQQGGSPTPHSERSLAIRFVVDTKKQCVFKGPLFSGTYTIRESVLARDIIFHEGAPFDIRKIETSQKRLQSRYYIADIQTGLPGIVSSNGATTDTLTTTDSSVVDSVLVPLYLTDNNGLGIDGALAYNSQAASRISGLMTLSLLNIMHRGEAFTLFYRGEQNLQQFNISLSFPYPFLWPVICSGSFGLEIEKEQYAFLEGNASILTQLKELWQAGVAFVGHETTESTKITDTTALTTSWNFIGADLVLQRLREPYQDGLFSREFMIKTGTGVANRANGQFSRWHFSFMAGSHLPLFKHQAFVGKITTDAITSDNRDTLHLTEKIRVGGYKSVRGYADNQFAYMAVAYAQSEYHFYFNPKGSVYIFTDGGIGFPDVIKLDRSNRVTFLGYGLGIRVPGKLGRISLEWARNIDDTESLGRIHLRITNALSSGIVP